MKKLLPLFLVLLFALTGCSRYNAFKPDTKANRKGFKFMTGVAADGRVRDVRVYADYFPGVDPVFCMAFKTTPEMAEKIIRSRKLEKTANSEWTDFVTVPPEIRWWNAEMRKRSDYYQAICDKPEAGYYFWYDPKTGEGLFMLVCM